PRLLEVLVLAAQAVVPERRERVERLQEQIRDLEPPELRLELLDQLLLVLGRLPALLLSHGPELPGGRARRRSPPSSRPPRDGTSAVPRSSPRAPRDTARRRAPPQPVRPT